LFFNNLDGSHIESGVSRLFPLRPIPVLSSLWIQSRPLRGTKPINATTSSVYQMTAGFGVHLPRHCDKFLHRNSRARRRRQQAGIVRRKGAPRGPAPKQTSRIDRCSYMGRRRENIPHQASDMNETNCRTVTGLAFRL
jgi:hypothetical protein